MTAKLRKVEEGTRYSVFGAGNDAPEVFLLFIAVFVFIELPVGVYVACYIRELDLIPPKRHVARFDGWYVGRGNAHLSFTVGDGIKLQKSTELQ
jgi:hypothetical protein